jgi:hypothetical protein
MRKQLTGTAKATLTVEVSYLGRWGPDCKLEQVYAQAGEAAKGRLLNALKEVPGVAVLGDIKVTAIFLPEN